MTNKRIPKVKKTPFRSTNNLRIPTLKIRFSCLNIFPALRL